MYRRESFKKATQYCVEKCCCLTLDLQDGSLDVAYQHGGRKTAYLLLFFLKRGRLRRNNRSVCNDGWSGVCGPSDKKDIIFAKQLNVMMDKAMY
jgi:hypothetical protein